jgi:hypothetical protein
MDGVIGTFSSNFKWIGFMDQDGYWEMDKEIFLVTSQIRFSMVSSLSNNPPGERREDSDTSNPNFNQL